MTTLCAEPYRLECPKRDTCLRATANPEPKEYQWYFAPPDGQMPCELYKEVEHD